jgi:hypothetical protein
VTAASDANANAGGSDQHGPRDGAVGTGQFLDHARDGKRVGFKAAKLTCEAHPEQSRFVQSIYQGGWQVALALDICRRRTNGRREGACCFKQFFGRRVDRCGRAFERRDEVLRCR